MVRHRHILIPTATTNTNNVVRNPKPDFDAIEVMEEEGDFEVYFDHKISFIFSI